MIFFLRAAPIAFVLLAAAPSPALMQQVLSDTAFARALAADIRTILAEEAACDQRRSEDNVDGYDLGGAKPPSEPIPRRAAPPFRRYLVIWRGLEPIIPPGPWAFANPGPRYTYNDSRYVHVPGVRRLPVETASPGSSSGGDSGRRLAVETTVHDSTVGFSYRLPVRRPDQFRGRLMLRLDIELGEPGLPRNDMFATICRRSMELRVTGWGLSDGNFGDASANTYDDPNPRWP